MGDRLSHSSILVRVVGGGRTIIPPTLKPTTTTQTHSLTRRAQRCTPTNPPPRPKLTHSQNPLARPLDLTHSLVEHEGVLVTRRQRREALGASALVPGEQRAPGPGAGPEDGACASVVGGLLLVEWRVSVRQGGRRSLLVVGK